MSLEITRLHLASLRGVDGLEWPVHGFVVTHPGGAVLVDTGVGGPQQVLDDWRVVNRSVADALAGLDMTPAAPVRRPGRRGPGPRAGGRPGGLAGLPAPDQDGRRGPGALLPPHRRHPQLTWAVDVNLRPEPDHHLFHFDIQTCLLTATTGHGDAAPQHTTWKAPAR